MAQATMREVYRKVLLDIMGEHDLSPEEVAKLVHFTVHAVHAWLKPETSKSSNPVPLCVLELLWFKLEPKNSARERAGDLNSY
jgi:hypothetical protein